jgi:hypothetical protein
MKVRIERRGGLAGKTAVGERDFEELTAAQQDALASLQKLPKRMVPSPGADRFHYKVTITDESGSRELDVSEDAMPDELASIARMEP